MALNEIDGTLDLFDHKTGEFIRHLTEPETTRYFLLLGGVTNYEEHTQGLVDGSEFGHDGTVYAA